MDAPGLSGECEKKGRDRMGELPEIRRVKDTERLYARPCQLVKMYDTSRTTIYRYLKEMRGMRRYQGSILDMGPKHKLVELKAWQDFLNRKNRAYLKEVDL